MDLPNGGKFPGQIFASELLGTCILMLAFNMSGPDELLAQAFTQFAIVVCIFEISGAHLNPAVSLGVYIAEKKYDKNFLFLLFYWVAQTTGALIALGLGYLLRVRTTQESTGKEYLVPPVYAQALPIVDKTDGVSSYG